MSLDEKKKGTLPAHICFWNNYDLTSVSEDKDLIAIANAALHSPYSLPLKDRFLHSVSHRLVHKGNIRYFIRNGQGVLATLQENDAEDLACKFIQEKFLDVYVLKEVEGWGMTAFERAFNVNGELDFRRVSWSYYFRTRKNFLFSLARSQEFKEKASLKFTSLTEFLTDDESVELIDRIPTNTQEFRLESDLIKIEKKLTEGLDALLATLTEREIALLISTVLRVSDNDLVKHLSTQRDTSTDIGDYFSGRDTYIETTPSSQQEEKKAFEKLRKGRQRVLHKVALYLSQNKELNECLWEVSERD